MRSDLNCVRARKKNRSIESSAQCIPLRHSFQKKKKKGTGITWKDVGSNGGAICYRGKGERECGGLITCHRVFEPFSRLTAPIQLALHGSKRPSYSYSAGIETCHWIRGSRQPNKQEPYVEF